MKKKSKDFSKIDIEIADWIFANPDKKVSDNIAVFCSKFQKTERTIWDYVQKAKEYNKTRLQKQEKAKEEVMIEQVKKSLKTDILNRERSLILLSTIARESKFDGEKIRAIQLLAKMQGWEAPTKIAETNSKGNDIERVTPEEAAIFIKEMTKDYNQE